MVVVNSTIEYAPYSFQTSGSFRTFCEHSNSSWSMFEPASQASLRKELFNRRRSKMKKATSLKTIGSILYRASYFPKNIFFSKGQENAPGQARGIFCMICKGLEKIAN